MTANASRVAQPVDVDTETLRNAIKGEYKEVAEHPGKGFHFHTGRRLTKIVGYQEFRRSRCPPLSCAWWPDCSSTGS